MTLDEHVLKLALAKKIAEWANKASDTDEWSNTGIYVHPDFEMHMADAAFAVFKAMVDSQTYKASQE